MAMTDIHELLELMHDISVQLGEMALLPSSSCQGSMHPF